MRVTRGRDPVLFFSKKEKAAIIEAIQKAEKNTSGEIRVHLERKADEDILAHAAKVFEKIGMTNTKERNGVLIFMGVKSKRFAIIGDRGIHEKVSRGFWQEMAEIMQNHFREDNFALGIAAAIEKAGEKLANYFPHKRDDMNELPDEISYSL